MFIKKELANYVTLHIVREGYLENVTPNKSESWTWAIRSPSPLPVLRMYLLPCVPTVAAVFKNAALRKQCVLGSIWTVVYR